MKAHQTRKTTGITIEPQQARPQITPQVTEISLNTPPLEKKNNDQKKKKEKKSSPGKYFPKLYLVLTIIDLTL